HRRIVGIAGILTVNDHRHAFQGVDHLAFGGDAVAQPVGDVLAGNAQGRAVLHESDIVDIRDLRTANSLIDPAHDIAEDALGVVVEFVLDILGRPVYAAGDRHGQNFIQAGARA